MNSGRIYLSPPNIGSEEFETIREALESGWVAPVGPALDDFEKDLRALFDGKHVLALNSGTSALHLSLVLAGVSKDDHVITSSLTFAACANVILYQGAIPVFMDCEEETWNLDPDLLESYLRSADIKPKAVIVTHLYGMAARIREIESICHEYEVVLIEDAAEAVGSTYEGVQLGKMGDYGVVSFNGNKIITTSGGGALVTDKTGYEKGLHLATQANSAVKEYHHEVMGYNYRMSNILAGLGSGQLTKLESFVHRKRSIFKLYQDSLEDHFHFTLESKEVRSNRWLTVGLLKTRHTVGKLIDYLDGKNIESRRLWKPLHMHPAYSSFEFIGTGVCERLFQKGICLPSGTGLTKEQQLHVIGEIKRFLKN